MSVICPKCQAENPDTQSFCGNCGTNLSVSEEISSPTKTIETAKEELKRGSIFAGRYEIIEELGKGGMGKVYRVEDTKVKEEIALKLIMPEIAADKKTIERFRNELKIARKIRHKNVCAMFDLSEEKGSHYITMEYVSGGDLKKFIRRSGQMGVGKAISIAKQICEGLEEAHSLGIIHRDLKPNNIMIDDNGNARIMDFGIARTVRGKGITGAGVMIGTPEYMSPEQVEAKDIDQSSDIYSLGIIMYEMLTGRLPFEADAPFAVGVKQKSEIPKSPKEYNSQIPDDLNRVILKCLEKDKGNRYQDAGEVRYELEKIEQGLPTTDRVIPKKKTLTSQEITVKLSLKKILIPTFAVIVIAITGLMIWSPFQKKEVATPVNETFSIAVLPFEDLSPEKDQGYLCDGIAEELINRLNMIENLWIPARTSSFSFKGKGLDIKEIGRKLDVDNVLEGSLRKSGIRLRITVRLVNVVDNKSIWYESYNRNEGDIFDLQDDISLAIIENLKIKLLGEDKAKIVKRHTDNPKAYNLYMMGRHFLERRGREDLNKAVEYFEQAIDEDPLYVLAYAALGYTYTTIGEWSYLAPKVVFQEAEKAALKALDLDDSIAEAHMALANVMYIFNWDWKNAEIEFRRAIEINPNDATVRQEYAEYLEKLDRNDEALQEYRKAQELDPLSLIKHALEGQFWNKARMYDRAMEKLMNVLDIDPEFRPAMNYLARSYSGKEMYKEALAIYQKLDRPLSTAGIYARMGNSQKALQILDEIIKESKEKYISPISIAGIYLLVGDKEKGFKWLELGYEEHDNQLSHIKHRPQFDSVRSDPRFLSILKRIGLEK